MTKNLKIELQWLQESLQKRLNTAAERQKNQALPNPPVFKTDDAFSRFVEKHKLIQPDRLLLILAMAVHLDPGFLDRTIKQGIQQDGDHVQLGGARSNTFRGLLPTAETFLFIVAGADMDARLKAWEWLRKHSVLIQKGIVEILKPQSNGDPLHSGILSVDNQVAEEIIFGESAPTGFFYGISCAHDRNQSGMERFGFGQTNASSVRRAERLVGKTRRIADLGH